MERVVAQMCQPVVSAADLDFLGVPAPAASEAVDWLAGDLPKALARLEAEMIRRALAASRGNRAEAAWHPPAAPARQAGPAGPVWKPDAICRLRRQGGRPTKNN
jgi:hypothetical protein